MPQQLEYVNCNLCGNNNFKKLYSVKGDAPFSYSFPLTYVQCRHCGLVYTNPRPRSGWLKKQYESEAYHPRITNKPFKYLEAILRANLKKLSFIEKYKKKGNLLDVGCASGFLLDFARLKSWGVHGLEFAKTTSTVAKKDFKLDVFTGTIEKSKFKPNFFDAIVSFNTIEHLNDPSSFLKKSYDLLKKDGILIVETPSLDSFHYFLLRKKWGPASDPGQHLYLFDKITLKKMLEKNGFKIIKIESLNSWTPWFYRGESGFFSFLTDLITRMISQLTGKKALIAFICVKKV